ncbi:MAG: hypothetical protein AB7N71_14285 [Phycisphaerae bacterium]
MNVRSQIFGLKSVCAAITRGSFFLIGLALFSGCQAPGPITGPTEVKVWIDDREEFIEDTLSILRREFFDPASVDRGKGIVITRPETSRQWFEFWRKDPVDRYQTWESSLHTIRRTVRVDVEPTRQTASSLQVASGLALDNPTARKRLNQQPETYRLQVTVDKTRYSAPDRQVTTSSGALGIYSERLPTTEGLRQSRAENERWVPMGRDQILEEYLLNKLLTNSAQVRDHEPWDDDRTERISSPPPAAPTSTSPPRTPVPARQSSSGMGTMQLVPN